MAHLLCVHSRGTCAVLIRCEPEAYPSITGLGYRAPLLKIEHPEGSERKLAGRGVERWSLNGGPMKHYLGAALLRSDHAGAEPG